MIEKMTATRGARRACRWVNNGAMSFLKIQARRRLRHLNKRRLMRLGEDFTLAPMRGVTSWNVL